jgi:hypothetical protein
MSLTVVNKTKLNYLNGNSYVVNFLQPSTALFEGDSKKGIRLVQRNNKPILTFTVSGEVQHFLDDLSKKQEDSYRTNASEIRKAFSISDDVNIILLAQPTDLETYSLFPSDYTTYYETKLDEKNEFSFDALQQAKKYKLSHFLESPCNSRILCDTAVKSITFTWDPKSKELKANAWVNVRKLYIAKTSSIEEETYQSGEHDALSMYFKKRKLE